jgi:F-type H+-transporting ATPase subunit epsilon
MAGQLHLRVVTPEKPVFDGEVESVVVPAHDGEIGILPRHARLLASLGAGELRADVGQIVERFYVEGGFVQVSDNRVTVLCDRASRLAELDARQAAAEADAAAALAAGPEAVRLRQRATALRRMAGLDAKSGGHA